MDYSADLTYCGDRRHNACHDPRSEWCYHRVLCESNWHPAPHRHIRDAKLQGRRDNDYLEPNGASGTHGTPGTARYSRTAGATGATRAAWICGPGGISHVYGSSGATGVG